MRSGFPARVWDPLTVRRINLREIWGCRSEEDHLSALGFFFLIFFFNFFQNCIKIPDGFKLQIFILQYRNSQWNAAVALCILQYRHKKHKQSTHCFAVADKWKCALYCKKESVVLLHWQWIKSIKFSYWLSSSQSRTDALLYAVNSYKIKSIGTSDPEQLGRCYDQKTFLSAEALTDRFLKTWTDTVKTVYKKYHKSLEVSEKMVFLFFIWWTVVEWKHSV